MSTESRDRDHANFRELAKLGYESADSSGDASGGEPSPASREESSGVVHLAELVAPALPPAPAPVAEEARAKPQPPPARHKTRRWLTVAGLLAAGAAGAAAMQLFGVAHSAPGPVALESVPASTAERPLLTEQPSATSDVRSPAATGGRNVEPARVSLAPAASIPRVARSASAPAARTAGVVDEPAPGAPPPTASIGGADSTLGAAMEQAVGPTSTLAPTSSASAAPEDTSDVAAHGAPLRPSLGAVDAALGATVPDARACLDRDDPISRATVTFRSDGHPASVSISGGARGKPAEACIRAALMRTHVGPFALDTFSVPVTIRPN